MAKRGGKRPGAGRPRGAQNRATKEQKGTLQELARSHTETALKTLVEVARKGESDAARVSAANALLDRAYGKPSQAVEVAGPQGGPIPILDAAKLRGATDEELDTLEKFFGRLQRGDGSDQGGEAAQAGEDEYAASLDGTEG